MVQIETCYFKTRIIPGSSYKWRYNPYISRVISPRSGKWIHGPTWFTLRHLRRWQDRKGETTSSRSSLRKFSNTRGAKTPPNTQLVWSICLHLVNFYGFHVGIDIPYIECLGAGTFFFDVSWRRWNTPKTVTVFVDRSRFRNEQKFFAPIDVLYINPKYMDVNPKIGGKPSKWMVNIMENPIKHGMIWGFTIIFGNTHLYKPQIY